MVEYLHPCADGTLEEEIESNKALRQFARELYHVYGLRVIGKTKVYPYRSFDTTMGYMVADAGELAIGRFFLEETNTTTKEFQYCYHSMYFQKERGSDTFDRHCLRSKKLSSLMRTMRKVEAVVNSDYVYQQRVNPVLNRMAMFVADTKGGNTSKGNYIGNEDWHKLLLGVKQGKTFEEINLVSKNSFQEILDKWNEVDKTRTLRDEEVCRFFDNGVAVGIDSFNQFIVVELVKSEDAQMTIVRKGTKRLTRDRKSTRLNSSHTDISRMPSSA